MSKWSIKRILQLLRSTGEVVPAGDGRRGKWKRVMDAEELEFLMALLEQNPDLYLDEPQEQLA
ncbi:hypothetical protein M422DRAFT_270481 [Sphaerobolus stellatus SS14]|uniref:Uncharacterized protein n=1 Tax=Sphaerobolus stellatus (strain SS14) TaxID=990650 RepID=A0A0C9TFT0_SPHS4|nr:hypothetical protein M422DRAFT_270481 [Sphaerobolus stellatus SS14]